MLLLQKRPAGNTSDELSSAEEQEVSQYTRASKFLPTSNKIIQFASSNEPKPGDKVGAPQYMQLNPKFADILPPMHAYNATTV